MNGSYCCVRPPPHDFREWAEEESEEFDLENGSLEVVSSPLYKQLMHQENILKSIDYEGNYWRRVVFSSPAPAPPRLAKWSSHCLSSVHKMHLWTSQPHVLLYSGYLGTLDDILQHENSRMLLWLENVFDGLISLSDHGLLPRYLTPSNIYLVPKDSHHRHPRFVMGYTSLYRAYPPEPKNSLPYLPPPEGLAILLGHDPSEEEIENYVGTFNALTPTSASPRRSTFPELPSLKDLSSKHKPRVVLAYGSFVAGMVLMAILRLSTLRHDNRDLYHDLSSLADKMTVFISLRRLTLEEAKEQFLDLIEIHGLRDAGDLDAPLKITKTRPKNTKTRPKDTKTRPKDTKTRPKRLKGRRPRRKEK
jgi:hypothetical protein